MKLLFISYDGLTDPLGQSQILPYIKGLCRKGYKYSIISFEKKEQFKTHYELVSNDLQKFGITWKALSYTKNPPLLSTIYDIISLKKEIKNQIKANQIDVIHCRSYISMFAAYPLAKKSNIKLIFDMRGFWIDERTEGGIWNLKNPIYSFLYKILKKKEVVWMNTSELIISLTHKGKQIILDQFKQSIKENIHVIPCCADQDHFNPWNIHIDAKSELLQKLGISHEDKILGYSGSIGTWYLGNEMMQQFKRLNEMDLFNKFLWVTKEDPERIYELAENNGIDRGKIIVKSANRKEMPLYLSTFDLGIFYIKPSFSKKASSPTKLGEMLLMGIPVLCNSNVGDLDEFFSGHKIGLCHDIEDFESVSLDDINRIMNLDRSNIKQVGIDQLSLSSGIDKYDKALNSLK